MSSHHASTIHEAWERRERALEQRVQARLVQLRPCRPRRAIVLKPACWLRTPHAS